MLISKIVTLKLQQAFLLQVRLLEQAAMLQVPQLMVMSFFGVIQR
jgi:hypothetical protein